MQYFHPPPHYRNPSEYAGFSKDLTEMCLVSLLLSACLIMAGSGIYFPRPGVGFWFKIKKLEFKDLPTVTQYPQSPLPLLKYIDR